MISVIRIYLLLANSSAELGPASQYIQVKENVPTENFVFLSREQILRDLKQILQCE